MVMWREDLWKYTHVVSTRYALLGGPGNSLVIGDQVTSLVLQAGSLIGG